MESKSTRGKYSEKHKKATMKYLKNNRDKLTLTLPLGLKEQYRSHAENNRGVSLTALICKLIDDDIQKYNSEKNN